MTYIDSWVKQAHAEVEGEPVPEQILAELSQVHRSSTASHIFAGITSIEVDSKAGLINLFKRVKTDGYNLTAALHDERLSKYIERTTPYAFD
jgi:hypothetical protein